MNSSDQVLLSRLNAITVIACLIIIGVGIGFYVYIKRKESHYKELLAKKQWIEQMPTMVSALGVLGTFLGITVGLWYFNTEDLDHSIPLLLSGLRTAFLTSLFGMTGSLVLTRIVNKAMDEAENTEGERKNSVSMLNAISNLVSAQDSKENKEFKANITSSLSELKKSISGIQSSMDSLKSNVEQVKGDLEQVKDDIEEIKGDCTEIKDSTASLGNSDTGDIPKLLAVTSTAAASIAKIDNDMEAIKDSVSSITESAEAISADVEDLNKDS